MSGTFLLKNRQRAKRLNPRQLRQICLTLLRDELALEDFEISVFLVGEPAMAKLNEEHLGHSGSTDVITFGYTKPNSGEPLIGDIFVCVPVAVEQAKDFGTTWQEEVVRYIVHGILHLLGHDDLRPDLRRKMKREEGRLLKRLATHHDLKQISRSLLHD